MFCIKCGKELRDDARFCKFCGVRIPDEFIENDHASKQKVEDIQKKDINATELIVDEDRGEETVLIEGVRDDTSAEPENSENNDKLEENEIERVDALEDDGETEIIDSDNTAPIIDSSQKDGNALKKELGNEEHPEKKSKELKYMGHVIDENVVNQSSGESQKQGASRAKIAILILSIVLVILIMIAVGLGLYYYLDNKMLREKYAEELVLPSKEDKFTEHDADGNDEADKDRLSDDED
jgi:hypothetical protein